MPIVGTQIYARKPGGRLWDGNNETGSNCQSDGIRDNIEFDAANSTDVESTFLLTLTRDPSSCTDKPWWSLKHGSHNHSCSNCMLYEISVNWSGSVKSFRIERGNSNYGGCSGGVGHNPGRPPLNKILGFKVCRWNIQNNTGVHMEYWTDFQNEGRGPWFKCGELDDTAPGKCGTSPMTTIRGSGSGDMQDTWRGNGASVVWHGQSRVEIIGGTSGGNPPPPPTHECPAGQVWSEPLSKCIPECPTGYTWDDNLSKCVPTDPSIPTCPTNQHWDFAQQRCVPDIAGPPPPEGPLKFVLSGGAQNSNPNSSIGGAPSTTYIAYDTMDNVFDDVGKNISQAETDYRCIYLRNTDGTRTLYNARCYLLDVDNYVGIVGNLSGVAGVSEQLIEDETTKPEGQYAIVYNLPEKMGTNAAYLGSSMWYQPGWEAGQQEPPKQYGQYTKVLMSLLWVSARAHHQHIARVTVYMARVGNPTGNFHVTMRDATDTNIIGTFGPTQGTPVSTLIEAPENETSYIPYTAVTLDADEAILNHAVDFVEDIISVEYASSNTEGSSTDFLKVAYHSTDDMVESPQTQWPAGWNGQPMIEPGYVVGSQSSTPYQFWRYTSAFCAVIYIKPPPCYSTSGPQKPTTYDTGIHLPDVPPGSYIGIWLAREMPKGAPSSADTKVSLIVEGDYQVVS